MIVVDTSAIIAILLLEPEATIFADAISEEGDVRISSVTAFEAAMVMEGRAPNWGQQAVDKVIAESSIEIVPFTAEHMRIARTAWLRYGRRRHRAALNFGDCCCYALAKELDAGLLYKGLDFAQTDIASALQAKA
ncbi:MAG: type II toxin-antitoxin system VapC family toxin [Reyranellaceae bacterium]